MKTYLLLGFGLVSALSVACGSAGSNTDEGAAGSDEALSGTVQTARGCATRDAYTKATVADLKEVAFSELSPALKAGLALRGATTVYTEPYGDLRNDYSISRLEVPGVGSLLVLEHSVLLDQSPEPYTNIDFFDARGTLALYGAKGAGSPLSFSLPVSSLTSDPATGKLSNGSAITPLVCE